MKFLIDIQSDPSHPIPRERIKDVIEDYNRRIDVDFESGAVEGAYKVDTLSGFFIANVPTLEDAWKLVMAYSNYPFWLVTFTPILDVRDFSKVGLEARNARLSERDSRPAPSVSPA